VLCGYLFIRSSIYSFIRLSVYPFIPLSLYPFIRLSVYPLTPCHGQLSFEDEQRGATPGGQAGKEPGDGE
jgi:hypothetical protein